MKWYLFFYPLFEKLIHPLFNHWWGWCILIAFIVVGSFILWNEDKKSQGTEIKFGKVEGDNFITWMGKK